mmetsp:Transcript_20757/g.51026  ORF Transcript_20757/g.51026 Transcript_20757/m.51026 type:complete len:205 (+) Transcript_20757:765-1379(+)
MEATSRGQRTRTRVRGQLLQHAHLVQVNVHAAVAIRFGRPHQSECLDDTTGSRIPQHAKPLLCDTVAHLGQGRLLGGALVNGPPGEGALQQRVHAVLSHEALSFEELVGLGLVRRDPDIGEGDGLAAVAIDGRLPLAGSPVLGRFDNNPMLPQKGKPLFGCLLALLSPGHAEWRQVSTGVVASEISRAFNSRPGVPRRGREAVV